MPRKDNSCPLEEGERNGRLCPPLFSVNFHLGLIAGRDIEIDDLESLLDEQLYKVVPAEIVVMFDLHPIRVALLTIHDLPGRTRSIGQADDQQALRHQTVVGFLYSQSGKRQMFEHVHHRNYLQSLINLRLHEIDLKGTKAQRPDLLHRVLTGI